MGPVIHDASSPLGVLVMPLDLIALCLTVAVSIALVRLSR
jgi:hypothetical protein